MLINGLLVGNVFDVFVFRGCEVVSVILQNPDVPIPGNLESNGAILLKDSCARLREEGDEPMDGRTSGVSRRMKRLHCQLSRLFARDFP